MDVYEVQSMNDIDRLDALEKRIIAKINDVYSHPKTEYAEGYVNACKAVLRVIEELRCRE